VSDEDARSEMDLVSEPLLKNASRIWAERERRSLTIGALKDDDRFVFYRCLLSAKTHPNSMRPHSRRSNATPLSTAFPINLREFARDEFARDEFARDEFAGRVRA
jgi:hypothetical protein